MTFLLAIQWLACLVKSMKMLCLFYRLVFCLSSSNFDVKNSNIKLQVSFWVKLSSTLQPPEMNLNVKNIYKVAFGINFIFLQKR